MVVKSEINMATWKAVVDSDQHSVYVDVGFNEPPRSVVTVGDMISFYFELISLGLGPDDIYLLELMRDVCLINPPEIAEFTKRYQIF